MLLRRWRLLLLLMAGAVGRDAIRRLLKGALRALRRCRCCKRLLTLWPVLEILTCSVFWLAPKLAILLVWPGRRARLHGLQRAGIGWRTRRLAGSTCPWCLGIGGTPVVVATVAHIVHFASWCAEGRHSFRRRRACWHT
jgi:hypothetical protein